MRKPVLWSFLALLFCSVPAYSLAAATPGFNPLVPARLLDTRVGAATTDGQFAGTGAFGPKGSLNLTVLGRGGVPASGVTTVILNVTVTGPTAAGFVTAWPAGFARPTASNLNFTPTQTVANLVTAEVGAGGQVTLYNSAGYTQIIADVVGYFSGVATLTSQTPARILDSRPGATTIDGNFAGTGALGAGGSLDLTVAGRGGVPSGAGAVIMNVTAVTPTASGYLTAWPTGTIRPPVATTITFTPTQVIPNLVVSPLGSNGQVSLYNSAGYTHYIADVMGWFPAQSEFTAVTQSRLLDTRSGASTIDGQFQGGGPVGAKSFIDLTVVGRGGIPASGVGAVVINVTASNPTSEGFITVFPSGTTRPITSNLNFMPGQAISNLVIAKVGSNGKISLFNSRAPTDLMADIVGWFPAPPTADLPSSDADAARFLTMATFGPNQSAITLVRSIGYHAWIAKQLALPPTLQRPYVEALDKAVVNPGQNDRMEAWFNDAITAPDQLRQRVAWALSQIMVVSDQFAGLDQDPISLAEYYDSLAHAVGGYKDGLGVNHPGTLYNLIYDITVSPAMSHMLTYLRNQKGNPNLGTSPDENYAREVMQLFTIGLELLNADGTRKLGTDGNPIPTYTQATVSAYAKIFTGWSYSTGFYTNPASSSTWSVAEYQPLVCYDTYHDFTAKTLLSYTGNYGTGSDAKSVPANNPCATDLQQGLTILTNHPNVAPFISRQLIQHLVTSNPTPDYVARVSTVFTNSGGDIGQVVTAILTDTQAMTGAIPAQYSAYVFGKAREPLLKLTALWRYYGAASQNGLYAYTSPQGSYAERPQGANSVFNFYSPTYLPPGEVGDAGLFGPQFQIMSESSVVTTANDLTNRLNAYVGNSGNTASTIAINLSYLNGLASNPGALVDQVNHDLLYGQMGATTRTYIVNFVTSMSATNPLARTQATLQLVLASPEFAIQK